MIQIFSRYFPGCAPWPWPRIDSKKVALKLFHDQELLLPSVGIMQAADHRGEFAWTALPEACNNTAKLWINSLMSIQILAWEGLDSRQSEYILKAISLLDSYFLFIDSSPSDLATYAWEDEHAVSNRLNALVALASYSVVYPDFHVRQTKLLHEMERHCNWLLADDHYVSNNHGTMMDLALLHAAYMIQPIDHAFAATIKTKSSSRLSSSLDRAFDRDGCCTENSPAYHFVNLVLYERILRDFQPLGMIDDALAFALRRTIDKARGVAGLLLKHNGSLPTIGDSEEQIGVFFSRDNKSLSALDSHSQTDSRTFKESGFFIYKSSRT